jgi:hypothetical protein
MTMSQNQGRPYGTALRAQQAGVLAAFAPAARRPLERLRTGMFAMI